MITRGERLARAHESHGLGARVDLDRSTVVPNWFA